MGRKAYSAQTHWLHGSKSQAAAPTESSIPAARAPKYPRGLPPALRRPFRDLCATLTARRALTDGDAELVALYVALADRRTRELAEADREGYVVTATVFDSNGRESTRQKKSLHLVIAQESEKTMIAVLALLGLSPTGRDKVRPTAKAAPQPQAPGELIDVDALLEQRGYSNALQTN